MGGAMSVAPWSVGGLVTGALVLIAAALAISRRSLGLASVLCSLALVFLAIAFAERVHIW